MAQLRPANQPQLPGKVALESHTRDLQDGSANSLCSCGSDLKMLLFHTVVSRAQTVLVLTYSLGVASTLVCFDNSTKMNRTHFHPLWLPRYEPLPAHRQEALTKCGKLLGWHYLLEQWSALSALAEPSARDIEMPRNLQPLRAASADAGRVEFTDSQVAWTRPIWCRTLHAPACYSMVLHNASKTMPEMASDLAGLKSAHLGSRAFLCTRTGYLADPGWQGLHR